MIYIAAISAALFCISVIGMILLRISWKSAYEGLRSDCAKTRSELDRLSARYDEVKKKHEGALKKAGDRSKEITELRGELSKKPVQCQKCGRLHKATEEILNGAMPGETLCGGTYCKNEHKLQNDEAP